jgi:hypothetical protein
LTCKCFSGIHGGIFVPNATECHATQKFIRKLYIKELVREEERVEKQRLEEIEEAERKQEEENKKNGIPTQKRKNRQTRRGGRRKLVDVEEKDVDIVAQKYVLMLVHALTLFEVDEIIASLSLGFNEFEQEFEVVCALIFSPPNSLPNIGGKEFSYFKQFGKGQFDDNRYNNCNCRTFVMALAQLFLYKSVKGFTFIGDGQLVVVPDKSTAKSYVLEFLKSRHILDSPHNDVCSFSSKDAVLNLPGIFGMPSIIRKCSINEAKGKVCASLVRFCKTLADVTCKVAMKANIYNDTITIPWSLLAIWTCAYMLTPQATTSKLVVLCVKKCTLSGY